ncbi:MAG TPA: hypothetical protein VMV07_23535 [Streptosporangiaceae bacterium]|nr:hypothetical protein [Streptosporangiaceae bacterium]
MAESSVLEIDQGYLRGLQTALQQILNDVTNQVNGLGSVTWFTGPVQVPPVDSSLTITLPGGTSGSGSTFPLGQELNAHLAAMGGTVAQEVQWLQNVLTDMVAEIDTTITAMSDNEQLNNEAITKLMNDFQQTFADLGTSPGSEPSSYWGSGSSSSGSSGVG